MFGQTVQTQIRLLLEEQSDQGLHCLLFHLHHLEVHGRTSSLSLNFRVFTVKLAGVQKLRNFTVTADVEDDQSLCCMHSLNEPRCEKIDLWGFVQVPHKPGCTATKDG